MDTGHSSSSSRASTTNPSPPVPNSQGGIYSPIPSTSTSTFIPPPPPPPLPSHRNTHSRQNSRTDDAGYQNPANIARTHSRTPSWIPPPPPPSMGRLTPSSIPHESASGALQLQLSHSGQTHQHHVPQRRGNMHHFSHSIGHSYPSRSNSVDPFVFNMNVPANSVYGTQGGQINYNPQGPQFIHGLYNQTSPTIIIDNFGYSNRPNLSLSSPYTHSASSPISPGTPTNNMLLSRMSPPFERGPFPASSVPPMHVLTTHAHSPSNSAVQSPPPPPRPPKPPELELDLPADAPPIVPQRLQQQQGQQLQLAPSPTFYRPVPNPVGAEQSPTLAGAVGSAQNHVGEDVNASFADSPDKVIGSLSGQAGSTSANVSYRSGQPDHAENTKPEDDDGHDGTRAGTNEPPIEDLDDARSDSGMTMESYDPAAFDFPRRVNDEMPHVLSPTVQSPPEAVMQVDSSNPELEGEAPPTYDQVELEARLSPTSARAVDAGIAAIVSPTARYPAPTFAPSTVPLPPSSPPPAFRPQTPPSPGSSTQPPIGSSSTQQRHHPPASGKRVLVSKQPSPFPALGDSGVNRTRSISDSSSGHGHDGLMMTPRDGQVAREIPQPSIFTSPPTPSPSHSPSRFSPKNMRLSLQRKFTNASVDMDSLGSRSPTSETSDPFMDPQAFQADASPFAPSKSSSNDSPRSIPSEMRSRSPPPESAESAPNKSPTWKGRHRSHSGFWSNVSSTPPTPKSEMSNNELGNRQADDSSTYQEVPVVNASDTARRRKSKSSGSRMSMFFRSPSTISSGHGLQQGPDQASASRSVRNGGVDLLADGADIGTWEQMPDEAGGDVLSPSDGRSPAEEEEQSVLMDLWEGIEYGFRAPGWNSPPAPGPYSNPTEWPSHINLYPAGSKPFFVRAPTWRSLLRFLASQSTLRIEPSVEALATSRTATIDLRLVVQFVRTPFTPRGTSRDICLYMMLHTRMPSLETRAGKALPPSDRVALGSWDTRALPYAFVCAEGGLLARHGAAAQVNYAPGASQLIGTPIADQDPDGADSMFITIPPPFIQLPVKMSDVALYLHECLVLSRKNGKLDRPKSARQETGGGLTPNTGHAKLRKGGHGSNVHLPVDGSPADATSGPPTPSSSIQDNDPIGTLFDGQASLSGVPGIKRLAKAVKTFYPEEYAIGSSKANQAAEQAAVEEDRYRGGMLTVSSASKGKSTSGKGGLLGAFHRVRSKSSVAKSTVSGLGAAGGARGSFGGGRDTNAERFELVTPWRE